MNERIKEFAEQAGATVCGGYTSHAAGSWSDTGDIDSRTLDVEKFAELIVAECLEACSRANEIRHFVPPTQEQVVYTCMREIEETFRS
jgi:hypothetical protein